ncbi:2-oxoglutarate ferredoxin oxidoreductase subunit gamma [Clostridiales Family XIII bacterium PM5-7]
MERNLLVAGFGGQGVMMLGSLLAQSATESTDKYVTYFPSYGAEMRGGTANCYVVISDEEIGAPVADKMEDVIVMNDPSLLRFIGRVKAGGTLFINSSIVKSKIDRTDIKVVEAPVTELSIELGNPKVINIIMLGVYIGYTGVIDEQIILESIKAKIGAKKPDLVPLNEKAFQRGLEIGKAAK